MIKVSVIIPARNEQEVIEKMVKMLLGVFDRYIYEIIVVNDGSTDNTALLVSKLSSMDKRVRLVNRTSPNGVGLAIRDGLRNVHKQCTHILTIDADFTRNIPDLFDIFQDADKHDGIIGSRFVLNNSLINYPFFKLLSNRLFHLVAWIVLGIQTKDLTNNFKLYKKSVWDSLELHSTDFSINAETGIYPILLGYSIKEYPTIWYGRDASMGFSKFKIFSVGPKYFQVILRAIELKSKLFQQKVVQKDK